MVDAVSPRIVQGIAAQVELVGMRYRAGETLHEYRMRLVPKMWLLRLKRTSRIFQDVTVADVVGTVLREAGVPHRWSVTAAMPRRSYCLQYEESDFAFIRRLCAEEGIYFYFQQPSGLFDRATGGVGDAVAAGVADVGQAIAGAVGGAAAGGIGGDIGGGIGGGIGAAVGEATDQVGGALGLTETVVFGSGPSGDVPHPRRARGRLRRALRRRDRRVVRRRRPRELRVAPGPGAGRALRGAAGCAAQ